MWRTLCPRLLTKAIRLKLLYKCIVLESTSYMQERGGTRKSAKIMRSNALLFEIMQKTCIVFFFGLETIFFVSCGMYLTTKLTMCGTAKFSLKIHQKTKSMQNYDI